ncbi:MAG: S9 family peptidase [Planctomyces sp.]|nr:S9 family peptidase [Planctomyces sp.]
MRIAIVAAAIALWASADPAPSRGDDIPPAYPPSRRVDQVDRCHGIDVADPYRWLETDLRQSAEVAEWVRAQNELTARMLGTHPDRAAIRRRLEDLWNYERCSSPMRAGAGYAYFRNNGLQNHAALYLMDTPDSQPRLLLDPNQWSNDGTMALTGTAFSNDGQRLAYAVSEAGSDWQTWRILDVASGRQLPDELAWMKFANVAWTDDGAGFFYNRYDAPAAETRFQASNLNQRVCYHRLGDLQEQDALVYQRPDHPDWKFANLVTPDGRYLILVVREADDDRHRILYQDLTKSDGRFIELIDRFEHQFHFIGNDGPVFYFMTNQAAPRRRLIAIDARQPEPEHWQEIIAEGKETLIDIGFVGERFLAVSLEDANTRVRVYTRNGDYERELNLPAIGTAFGFGGRREDAETFYSFSSFTTPSTVYRYDIASGRSAPLRKPEIGFDPQDYDVKQVFFTSRDGTRVPMFISHKKGVRRDGSNPTLLYGYGGFGFSLKPWFSVSALAWMEAGGVYAVPNLRGGGEYGAEWHLAGMKLKRQNVFDDFIAAAEFLIDQQYTRSDKLAIEGGSNGGLLVAAVLIQRPDLFGACLPEVPLTDMLRYPRFTNGQDAVPEFGSPDDAEEFQALLAYSPYHNIRTGSRYPPTLLTTGDTDDRVHPLHSFKFAAALQHAQSGPSPVLLRVEVRGGHGGDKPAAKRIEEVTDQFVFLTQALQFQWSTGRP